MLENIKDMLRKLNEEFPDWQEILIRDPELLEDDDEKVKEKIVELIVALKQKCKEKGNCDLDFFMELLDEREIAEILQSHVNKSLVYYNILQPIRTTSYQNPEIVKKLIDDVFHNYILRYDPSINERYEIYSSEGENAINEIMRAIDRLTAFYAERLLIETEVEKDFEDETGFSKEICEFYAQLYEKHFQELKMNIILHGIGAIQGFLKNRENE